MSQIPSQFAPQQGEDNESQDQKDQYNPLASPPNLTLALRHGNATRIGKMDMAETDLKKMEFCECCGLTLNHRPVPVCGSRLDLHDLGAGFPLYFEYLFFGGILLFVMFLIVGIWGLISSYKSIQCDLFANDTTYPCRGGFIIEYSMGNKEQIHFFSMRFSTTNSVSMTHSNSTSTFKKVLSSLVSKLPHQQPSTVTPIKEHRMPPPPSQQQLHIQKHSSAITKQDDIHRNLRDYYTTQNSRKRQYEEPLISPLEKNTAEREIRHKTVKQYQQTRDKKQQKASYQHWKEYSNTSSNIVNKSAPPKYKTHGYVRDTRANPNHLRITAITNACSSSKIIISKEKQCLPKRRDEFQWGSKSKLSNAL